MPPYVPEPAVLAAFTVAGIILFITPGPDMSLWLARTITGGRRAGIAAMLGTALGCTVHSCLAAAGISVLISASPIAFNTMKIVGGLYLLWLAWGMIRHGTTFALDMSGPKAPRLLPTFMTGLAVNLSNPKVVIFFITFLPGFVSATDPHASGKLLFLGLYFVAFNTVLSTFLIFGAERTVAFLRLNPHVLRVVDYLFAGVFGLFALKILTTRAQT